MSEYIQTYTFNQAKEIAEAAAFEQLEPFMDNKTGNVLDEKYFEVECCWFFFRNKQIVGPPEQVLRWGRAYAVSKKGELRLIADFLNEPDKLHEYLQVMSNHFKERGL